MCVNPTKEHGTKTKNTMQYTRFAKTLKHLVIPVILWLHPRHTEGPRQGGQPGATATSLQQSPTNTRSKPHCRWWHHWTLIPLSQVRDWTHILLDTLSGSSQTEPQWEIRGYIFGIEHLYDKTKQALQQCGHLLYSWMGRLNTEYGQIPTEVFFLIFFFGPHGWNYSKMDKEKIKEPEHQT